VTPTANVVAIIPARGGSKGIPGKNLVPLAGKPLIAFSIEQARDASSVSRVVVSTDSVEIADTARTFGADVVARPVELAGDTASSESALLHALDELRAKEGYEPDLVVFLQATSPLRRPSDIDGAVARLLHEDADSLFSCFPIPGFIWRRTSAGPVPLNYEPSRRPTRQEAPEDIVENGSIYVFKPWVLTHLGSRLGGRIAVYPMSAHDSWQIDEPADVAFVEAQLLSRFAGQVGGHER
jgi:CMP-N,N'-diacetyllegionaminic acid synthase